MCIRDRFYVISKQKAQPSAKAADGSSSDKTAIMFTTTNEPGALVNVCLLYTSRCV